MELHEAHRIARRLMDQHGLSHWGFAFNRAKRQLGVCRYQPRLIELSRHFVIAHDEAPVRDTILHEIAHALAGPRAGHGPKWRTLCRRIGATPQRCATAEVIVPIGRWQATCPGCLTTHHRHRRPLRGRDYYCRPCGPRRGPLTFQLTPTADVGTATPS